MTRGSLLRSVVLLAAGLCAGAAFGACSAGDGRAGPPDFPARAPLSPSIILSDGRRVTAGTAFCVQEPGRPPVVLTALHILGPPGGLPARIKAAELPAQVARVELYDVFSGGPVAEAKRALALPGAPFDEDSVAGDVAAFVDFREVEIMGRLTLSPQTPPPGEPVWLLAQVAGGAPPSQGLHRAVMDDDAAPDGGVLYQFESAGLDLTATSGAPILNAKGEVIAIHLSATKDQGGLVGYGHPTARFQAPLLAALDADRLAEASRPGAPAAPVPTGARP